MDTMNHRTQENSPARVERQRHAWSAPKVVDHGSLRWFVRAISGTFDDGHTSTSGGGGTMESKPKQT
jgi:hypothetical protein